MSKKEALAKYLECSIDDVQESAYDNDIFEAEGGEYFVLTDEEADEKAGEYIKDLAWAFNSWFIIDHMKESPDDYDRTQKAIEIMQSELCENANPIILSMIENVGDFIEDAIRADGRGHFLNNYDGCEYESGEYFIYQIN